MEKYFNKDWLGFTTLVLIFITLGFASPGFASSDKIKIQTTFQFKDAKKSLEQKGDLVLALENNSWTTVMNNKSGFVILGRLGKSKSGTVDMEYLVVDPKREGNGVVANPHIIARLGEPAEMTIGGEAEKVSLKILAVEAKGP